VVRQEKKILWLGWTMFEATFEREHEHDIDDEWEE
jgi:hypothetical protein